MSIAVGIDFGTSNTAVAISEQGQVRSVPLDPGTRISNTSPSVLYFPDEGPPSFGSAAMTALVEDDMRGRYIQAIKRHLPSRGFKGTWVGDKFRTMEELVGGYLRFVLDATEREVGEPITRAVLGRPARFHEDDAREALAQSRLEEAARIAGLTDVQFQLEPIAAARGLEPTLDAETICLVGDLGGGTSDFTLIRLSPDRVRQEDRSQDVLAVHGINVAGNDFDASLIRRFVLPDLGVHAQYKPLTKLVPIPTKVHVAITQRHTMAFVATEENEELLDRMVRTGDDPEGLRRLQDLVDANCSFPFFDAVGRAKELLSSEPQTRLGFRFDDIELDPLVERAGFEEAAQGRVDKIGRALDETLLRAQLEPADVGLVFLTGGTSQVPAVRALFEERFAGRVATRDAFTSVSGGLAVTASART